MFTNSEEATQKLSNTVVVYNGEPVYVRSGRMIGRKVGIDVVEHWNGGGVRSYTLDDPNLNYKDLGDRIGYVNYIYGDYNEAVYCSRAPVRRAHSTQGIGSENIVIAMPKGNSILGLIPSDITWSRLYPTVGFADMMRKNYPSLDKAYEEIGKGPEIVSRAFERQWALVRDPIGLVFLEYRGNKVGYFPEKSVVKFSEEFYYLIPNFQKKFSMLRVA